MSNNNPTVTDPTISGEGNLSYKSKGSKLGGRPWFSSRFWRVPNNIEGHMRGLVPHEDENVLSYYEQIMWLKRAISELVNELDEAEKHLLPEITEEDKNRVLGVTADGTTDWVLPEAATSVTADVQQTPTGATVTITDYRGTTTANITNGADGATGPAGETGPQGPAGPQGVPGEAGPQGVQGIQGPAGEAGADGFSPIATVEQTGANEATFSVTDKNGTTTAVLTGAAGPAGPQGEVGPAGPTGNDGVSPTARVEQTGTNQVTFTVTDASGTSTATLTGEAGATGPAGPQGPQGVQGEQGVKGDKGDKGDTGDIGPAGPQGQQGIQGVQGEQGPQGAQGPAGPAGEGVPAGGTRGQVLRKTSDADYDTEWYNPPDMDQKQYELDYVKENGSWFTTLSDGATVQKLPVPAEWTQGGSGAGINVLLPDYTYETVLAARNDALNKHIPAYYSDDNVWMVPIICFTIEPWNGSNGPCAWYLDMANNQFVGLCGSYGGEGKIYKTLSSTCEYEADTTYNTVTFGDFNGITTTFADNGDDTFTFRTVNPGTYYNETTLPTKKYVDDILLPHYKFVRWDDYFGPGTVRKVGSCNLDNDEYDIFEFYYRTGALPDKTSITYPLTPTLDDYTIKTFIEASGFTNHGHMISSGRTDNSDNTVIIQQTSINSKTVTLRSYGDLSRNIGYLKFTFIGTKNTP